jgi:molecular chaperone HtpG
MQEKGTISVHSENIFPIIKKFLYSDHDVFLRELVANAVDATQKLKQLASLGEYHDEVGQLRIKVAINEKLKTLTISDQGLGMTTEEIKKYINQVAFSGATAFVEKYKDKGQQQQLIGFFGLGFYSAFMVADRVDIITKSYQKDAEAVHWSCDGSTTFELGKAVKKEVGTDVVLYLNADSEEFLQNYKIKEILNRYCKFLPVEIEFDGEVINNTQPIWVKSPSELKEEDYLKFYKELYPFSPDPLFWIHLNVDYPFNLTGVLYFPQVTQKLEHNPNKIQLYAKQVFITEEVKDIVPPFLMLLHGVIDSPDIPLNVSRSYLQADSNVKKINTYITKKVADKLEEIFKKDRKAYEEKWASIELFVKYGMLTEDKFYEKAKDFVLLKSVDNQCFTLPEYLVKINEKQTGEEQNTVILYANNIDKQDWYIQACKQRGYDVLLFDGQLDSHFLETLERKFDKVRFKSVDAEPIDKLISPQAEQPVSVLDEKEQNKLQDVYKQAIKDSTVVWSTVPMPSDELPVVITVPEFVKRLHAMAQLQPNAGMPPMLQLQASINVNHPLAKKILSMEEESQQIALASKAYQLALLSQNMLNGTALTEFIRASASAMG